MQSVRQTAKHQFCRGTDQMSAFSIYQRCEGIAEEFLLYIVRYTGWSHVHGFSLF